MARGEEAVRSNGPILAGLVAECRARGGASARGRVNSGAAHLAARTAENRTNTVFRNTHRRTDFLVALALQVVHANDVGLGALQRTQQTLHFFLVDELLLSRRVRIGNPLGRMRAIAFSQSRRRHARQQFLDHDPSCHNRQVGRQAALAAEVAQHGKIVLQRGEKDLGTQIVTIRRRQTIDDMVALEE